MIDMNIEIEFDEESIRASVRQYPHLAKDDRVIVLTRAERLYIQESASIKKNK